MTNTLLAAGGLILTTLLSINVAGAQSNGPECEMLFVQTARSVSMDSTTLTLDGTSPLVTFFCDRPVRYAGHMSVDEYLQSWDAGKDSFKSDPPNAMISVLDGDDAHDVVVELKEKPAVNGDRFTYQIEIIEGNPVSADKPGSMFIDIIGRPMTPLSYAGVGRRTTRRVVRRCAAGVTCW